MDEKGSDSGGARDQEASRRIRSRRQELSLAERVQVIRLRDAGKTMRELALQFNCGKTQIMNIMSQRERYLREWEENDGYKNPFISARKRRARKTGNEDINQAVWEWYRARRVLGHRVTGPMLQRQAKTIALNLGNLHFAASNGWLESFRKIHNIGPVTHKRRSKNNRSTSESGSAHHLAGPSTSTSRCDDLPQPSTSSMATSGNSPVMQTSTSEQPPTGQSTRRCTLQVRTDLAAQKASVIRFSRCRPSPPPVEEDPASGSVIHSQEKLPIRGTVLVTPSQGLRLASNHSRKPSDSMIDGKPEAVTINTGPEADNVSGRHPVSDGNAQEGLPPVTYILPDRSEVPDCFSELIRLARTEGLISLCYVDELGGAWLELRQSVASFRVPLHGYRTHLARLVVDSGLRYWLEVVGHCIRHGSLRTAGDVSLDYSLVISVLCALNGNFTVCKGRGSALKRVSEFQPKIVIELGMADDMYFTLPDYRYRSHKCLLWLDKRAGPWCEACVKDRRAQENGAAAAQEPLNLSTSSGNRPMTILPQDLVIERSTTTALLEKDDRSYGNNFQFLDPVRPPPQDADSFGVRVKEED